MPSRKVSFSPYKKGPKFTLILTYPSGLVDAMGAQTMSIALLASPGGTKLKRDLPSDLPIRRPIYKNQEFTPADRTNPFSDNTVSAVLRFIASRRLNRYGMEIWLNQYHVNALEREADKYKQGNQS